MAKQFFVLGIGGTGMRCIESLIHLCAMGMFDDTIIHLLALDTDKNNGNFGRLKELKEAYLNAKGLKEQDRVAHKDTFFSANIKYYEFSPDYEKKSSFKDVFNYGDTQFKNSEETDLADLLLDRNVEEFNLQHGYRAQPHLGSMMMYQSIVEAAQSNDRNGIKDFVSALITETTSGKAKVFILGSVFGGTGASSIPIIPQALSQAAQVKSNGNAAILPNTYFGSTLLTAYFNFNIADKDQIEQQKVIATSDKFALNSKVAMMFYDEDATVRSIYQRFYMMGTSDLSWNPMQSTSNKNTKTITGGAEQKNDSHYIELFAACAALDFLNYNDNNLQQNKNNFKTDYVYRAVSNDYKFEFKDFVGTTREKEFAKKLGCLVAFALFNNGVDDFVEKARSGEDKEIVGFDGIDPSQVIYLKQYFRLFFAKMIEGGALEEGWLRQIHRSAGGGDKFLLNAELFAPQTMKDLMKFAWNKNLYRSEGIGKDNKYKVYITSSKFNKFKDAFLDKLNNGKDTGIANPGERIYKIIYDTLTELYNF
ncbi:MAG: hypothetical protein LUC88_03505 [Prevotella sp.]|nr:hypothetical protein [Prevotella sp.]